MPSVRVPASSSTSRTHEYALPEDTQGGEFRLLIAVWNGEAGESDQLDSDFSTFSVEGAEIVGFRSPEQNTYVWGDAVQASISVKNTGVKERSFWVGISFFTEESGAWPDGWLDAVPFQTSVLNGGETETIDFEYLIEEYIPEGIYKIRASVWNEYDPDLDPLDPGQMVKPRFDTEDYTGFTLSDHSEDDPYGIAKYDNVALFDKIPKAQRSELSDMDAMDKGVLISINNQVLNSSTRKLLFFFHGWNSGWNNESPYTDTSHEWKTLTENIALPKDWELIPYLWRNDSSLPIIPKPQATKSKSDSALFKQKKVRIPIAIYDVTRQWAELRASYAAMRGFEHGLMVTKKLEEQHVLSQLEKVQIVAHSAGTWAALGLAQGLHKFGPPELEIQVVYLDPFIPSQTSYAHTNLFSHVRYFNSEQISNTPNYTTTSLPDSLQAQAFYAVDVITDDILYWLFDGGGATSVTWDWNENKEGIIKRTDRDFIPEKWTKHNGPVKFYAESADPSLIGDEKFKGYGWEQSLVYQDANAEPAQPVIEVSELSLEFEDTIVGECSGSKLYTITGANLTDFLQIVLEPLDHFELSYNNTNWLSSFNIEWTNRAIKKEVYIRFCPQSVGEQESIISNSSDGAATKNVLVTGTGLSEPVSGTPVITASKSSLDNFGDIQVGTLSFSQNYTISGSDLTESIKVKAPEGFQISFSESSGYEDSLEITPSNGNVGGATIHVRFSPIAQQNYGGNITHSSIGTITKSVSTGGTGITTITTLPEVVSLISPQNESQNISTDTLLLWNEFEDAEKYQVQLLVITDKLIIINSNIYSSTPELSLTGLRSGTQYFWRVRTINASDTTRWSDIWSFTTQNGIPGTVKLLNPANDTTIYSYDETRLVWENSQNAGEYNLQFAEDQEFEVMILDSVFSAPDTSYLVTKELIGYEDYYWRVQASNTTGLSGWSDVFKFTVFGGLSTEEESIPTGYILYQNYPNPFNPTTSISYSLPQASFVKLEITNILGQSVAILVHDQKPAGNYKANFEASKLSSGVYFYTIEAGDFRQTRKMLLIK